jgi:nucleotide-binding universal stress UspA family protein
MEQYRRLLLATDGSEPAARATEHALALADACDARVEALYVVETRTAYDTALVDPSEMRANLRAAGEEALAAVTERAEAAGVDCRTEIATGVPATCIADRAEAADLVVVGESGHSSLRTTLLGSTADAVVRTVETPVVVV